MKPPKKIYIEPKGGPVYQLHKHEGWKQTEFISVDHLKDWIEESRWKMSNIIDANELLKYIEQ